MKGINYRVMSGKVRARAGRELDEAARGRNGCGEAKSEGFVAVAHVGATLAPVDGGTGRVTGMLQPLSVPGASSF